MDFSKRFLHSALLVTFALGFSQAAHAGETKFNFTFSSSIGLDATGTLFATDNSPGSNTFTADSGSMTLSNPNGGVDAGTYSLVSNPNAPGSSSVPVIGTYDDQLMPTSGPALTDNGLLFVNDQNSKNDQNNKLEINIFYQSGNYYLEDNNSDNNNRINGTFTVTPAAVPELSSMSGFGSFAAIGGLTLLRRRKLNHIAAYRPKLSSDAL